MTFPLFIVTGLSGSGKSTTTLELQKVMTDFNVYDMDLIVNNEDYQTACENWLRIAYSNALSGRATILFGNVPSPYNVEICSHFPLFNPIHYLHLYCNEEVRTQRLTVRGGWKAEDIRIVNEVSEKLVNEARTAVPSIPIIDTSHIPVSKVVDQLKKWVMNNS
ncbi:hypothetical protein [Peribacillus frigoritolerans]|uniref:hypothetical protein n=1 Tax=Peribacillus frigoritolerans TaxID=450367 RepID=UPI002282A3EB|nr:hypothetical protein [Peribacillus frigoritolerans]MCY9007301.1 AAA family ATPase [Peribacillus frigoritolerans]